MEMSRCSSIHIDCWSVRNSFLAFFCAMSKLNDRIALKRFTEKKPPTKIKMQKKIPKYALLFRLGPASSASRN